MAVPTFNAFSLQDENFISERITFKGYADRGVIRGKINRREGVKLLATEFGEKEVTIEGRVIADSASDLQSLLDDFKKNLTIEEGDLVIETGRTFNATVTSLAIPDEHYNQSTAIFEVTFLCSEPYAVSSQVIGVIPVPSGVYTVSGTFTVSGTLFNRPIFVYSPPELTGNTLIRMMRLYHAETGQTVTISGFGAGSSLSYQNDVTINLDDFSALEGSSTVDIGGGFQKFEPGINNVTLTASGRAFPGGSLTVRHQPRWL